MSEELEKIACLSLISRTFKLEDFFFMKEKIKSGETLELAFNQLSKFAEKFPHALKEAEENYEEIKEQRLRVTYPGENSYPQSFLQIHHPPILLTYYGNLFFPQKKFLSIVGSRNPSSETTQWMNQVLGPFLRQKKCIVVSGAARGVDQKAHALALKNKRPTIAVLPSGLKETYPSYFDEWVQEIVAQGGAVISEYAPFQKMKKHHFCQRNRLISALSSHLLLLDVSEKSGSIMTANYALEQNKEIAVVPSAAVQKVGWGGLRLISEGASVVYHQESLQNWFEP